MSYMTVSHKTISGERKSCFLPSVRTGTVKRRCRSGILHLLVMLWSTPPCPGHYGTLSLTAISFGHQLGIKTLYWSGAGQIYKTNPTWQCMEREDSLFTLRCSLSSAALPGALLSLGPFCSHPWLSHCHPHSEPSLAATLLACNALILLQHVSLKTANPISQPFMLSHLCINPAPWPTDVPLFEQTLPPTARERINLLITPKKAGLTTSENHQHAIGTTFTK